MIVDTPSKNFAYEVDVQYRIHRPPAPKKKNDETGDLEDQDEEEYYGCWGCTKRVWPIYAFLLWFILVWASTEIYVANHPKRDPAHPNEVQAGNHWTREYGHGRDMS